MAFLRIVLALLLVSAVALPTDTLAIGDADGQAQQSQRLPRTTGDDAVDGLARGAPDAETREDSGPAEDVELDENGSADALASSRDGSLPLVEESSDGATDRSVSERDRPFEEGVFTVRSALDRDYVLDVDRSMLVDGATVALWSDGGYAWQQFAISYDSDGCFELASYYTGVVLDVELPLASRARVLHAGRRRGLYGKRGSRRPMGSYGRGEPKMDSANKR